MAGLVLTLGAGLAHGEDDPNPGVLPPNSSAYGATYGEWSGMWWHWALSLPADEHPLLDTADCSAGQAGNVWFLGGSFGTSEVERECTVPLGTALFFPVLNTTFIRTEPDETSEVAIAAVTAQQDQAEGMFASLTSHGDLMEITNLDDYRSPEAEFEIGPVPAGSLGNVSGLEEGQTYFGAGDGVYLMLAPLPPGEHTFHFGGAYPQDGFSLDITYHITVEP